MAILARRLRSLDYFTLAFGAMVGVGWLVAMNDWLRRGGPLGAILGFAIGGAVLLPIGYVYGRIIAIIPDAASEIAYTAKPFSSGATRGSSRNLHPAFNHTGWISVLLVVQIVPYFMTGFESVAKRVEEAAAGFETRNLFTVIFAAILAGTVFYILVIGAVAFVYPWKGLVHSSFATALAFERAFGAWWITDLILAGALLSLLKVLNGNFVAASRLVFSMGGKETDR